MVTLEKQPIPRLNSVEADHPLPKVVLSLAAVTLVAAGMGIYYEMAKSDGSTPCGTTESFDNIAVPVYFNGEDGERISLYIDELGTYKAIEKSNGDFGTLMNAQNQHYETQIPVSSSPIILDSQTLTLTVDNEANVFAVTCN